jgi:hypothetical protein
MSGARPGLAMFIAGATLSLAGCAHAEPAAVQLTGLGAMKVTWTSHHGAGYSSVLTDPAGRVRAYVLTWTTVRPLARAQAQVTQDLPADAIASQPKLTVGIEGTTCEIVTFTSATLQRALGGGSGDEVMASFGAENAIVMDTDRIVRVVVVAGSANLPRQC